MKDLGFAECLHCGKRFKKTCGSQIYCCASCRKSDYPRVRTPKIKTYCEDGITECVNCGKKFKKRCGSQIYCCAACRDAKVIPSRVPTVIRKCPTCGKEFEGTARSRYCSTECKNRWFAFRHRGSNGIKSVEQECCVCHKKFTGGPKTHCCSPECLKIHKEGLVRKVPVSEVEKECPICHRKFFTAIKHKKYCCDACREFAELRKLYVSEKSYEVIHRVRKCATCGKEFVSTHPLMMWCSSECLEQHIADAR